MKLTINGQTQSWEPIESLGDVIRALEIGAKRYAVEHNGQIISKQEMDSVKLNDGDVIEVVAAIGGG